MAEKLPALRSQSICTTRIRRLDGRNRRRSYQAKAFYLRSHPGLRFYGSTVQRNGEFPAAEAPGKNFRVFQWTMQRSNQPKGCAACQENCFQTIHADRQYGAERFCKGIWSVSSLERGGFTLDQMFNLERPIL